MKFVDEVTIRVKAGDGGDGAVAFRREAHVPRGGPAGGDGGDGGDVVLEVDEGLSTLLDYRYRPEHRAQDGERGKPKDMYGRSGESLVLRVPPGTIVRLAPEGVEPAPEGDLDGDEEGGPEARGVPGRAAPAAGRRGPILADLRQQGDRFVVARGGKGGRGNIHFATSTDRAPRKAEPGGPGEQRCVTLELKLLADVGIVGFPNSGKSSLISVISAARPKIAAYPFTTLVPNLGMVRLPGDSGARSFVVADVPGLIEGAHQGAGLGHRFLRHLDRTRALLVLLELSAEPGRDPVTDFKALLRELELYDPALAARPRVVALNKADLPDTQEAYDSLRKKFRRMKETLHLVSAVSHAGIPELLETLWSVLHAPPPSRSSPARARSRKSPARVA